MITNTVSTVQTILQMFLDQQYPSHSLVLMCILRMFTQIKRAVIYVLLRFQHICIWKLSFIYCVQEWQDLSLKCRTYVYLSQSTSDMLIFVFVNTVLKCSQLMNYTFHISAIRTSNLMYSFSRSVYSQRFSCGIVACKLSSRSKCV